MKLDSLCLQCSLVIIKFQFDHQSSKIKIMITLNYFSFSIPLKQSQVSPKLPKPSQSDSSESVDLVACFGESDGLEIDFNRLKQQDPILFFDDNILYEDELGDNGISILSVKIVNNNTKDHITTYITISLYHYIITISPIYTFRESWSTDFMFY